MPTRSNALLRQHNSQQLPPARQQAALPLTNRQCWRWHLIYWLAYLLMKSAYLSQLLPLQGLSVAPAVLSYAGLTAISVLWSSLLLAPLLSTTRTVRAAASFLLRGLLPLLLLLMPLRILLLQQGSAGSFNQWYHYLVSGLPQTLLPLAGWLALVLLLLQQQQQQRAQQQQQRLQQQLQQARLALLHYQLEPHFLFNCLNALDTLVVRRQASAAIALTEQLALFLRQACKTSAHWQGWPDELATMQSYLAISQSRFGGRLTVHWHLRALPLAALPPLLLQPCTELLIEQLVAAQTGSYLFSVTTARPAPERWQITLQLTSQSGQPLQVLATPAALLQLQQRLAQSFDAGASCQLQQTETDCQIIVTIPERTDG